MAVAKGESKFWEGRCNWGIYGGADCKLYADYHDNEWGIPMYGDDKLFEMICLEGAQSGLSWITILKKRPHYRKAFHGFKIAKCAKMTEADVKRLLSESSPHMIVKNKLKIKSVIANAQAAIEVQKEVGSLERYLWSFVKGKAIQNKWTDMKQVPAETKESQLMAKDMKKRGFKFIGSTVCYALMQSVGLVNDHIKSCICYKRVAAIKPKYTDLICPLLHPNTKFPTEVSKPKSVVKRKQVNGGAAGGAKKSVKKVKKAPKNK